MELPVRILVIAPEPSGTPWASTAGAAWTALETSLRDQVQTGGIELRRLSPTTSQAFDDLTQTEVFHVVHLVAHGTSRPAARHGTVTLEGSDGRPRDLNAQNFARTCAHISGLELVVLQVVGGSPTDLDVLRDTVFQQASSVACTPASGLAAAVEFARVLYVSLTAGQSIENAFGAATANPGSLQDASPVPDGARLLSKVSPQDRAAPARPRRRVETPPPGAATVTSTPQTVGPPEDDDARVAARELERKRAACAFDVFLCHNVGDKPAVMEIGRRLMARGVLPWLDQWELRPGIPWQRVLEQQIANIRSAAVFVGGEGIGPWQRQELDGFLREFNKRQCPVIPVMLPGASGEPELPLFLRGMTWVDFRSADPDPLARLIWGITGERPPS